MKIFGDRVITRRHHTRALQELLFTLVLGLMPLWLGLLLIIVFARGTPLGVLVDHGQLIVFSAALLAIGFFGCAQEFRAVNFGAKPWFLLALVTTVTFNSAVFSVITFKELSGIEASSVELSAIRICSVVVLCIAIVLAYSMTVINNAETIKEFQADDLRAEHKTELDDLDKRFNELGGKK